MKRVDNWKKVFRKYSFVAHLLVAISSVAPLLFPLLDYVPTEVMFAVVGTLALFGIIGSFIKQRLDEDDSKPN
jgi:predicted membrane channel-forming protein YqfA (hemolysin III family)